MLHKNAKNNSSSFLSTMKTLCGNTRKEQEELSEKQIKGFNIYFTTIGKILSNKLIDLGKIGRQKRTLNSMFLTSTNEAEISLVIKKLESKYRKTYFPKMFEKSSSNSNTKVQECLRSSELQPISLLPTIGKILEKILCDRMTRFFEKYEMLNKNQFGFRQKRGTTDALVNFLERRLGKWI